MRVYNERIEISTRGSGHLVNLTEYCEQAVSNSGIKNGILNVFVTGSTASIGTIEYESGLLQDLPDIMDRIAPSNYPYRHNEAWGDANGHSHIRSTLMSTSFSAPIVDGKLALGTWQQVILAEWDIRPRNRKITFTIIGE
jgi:secondary thiamine-phosphate synthase enzyme